MTSRKATPLVSPRDGPPCHELVTEPSHPRATYLQTTSRDPRPVTIPEALNEGCQRSCASLQSLYAAEWLPDPKCYAPPSGISCRAAGRGRVDCERGRLKRSCRVGLSSVSLAPPTNSQRAINPAMQTEEVSRGRASNDEVEERPAKKQRVDADPHDGAVTEAAPGKAEAAVDQATPAHPTASKVSAEPCDSSNPQSLAWRLKQYSGLNSDNAASEALAGISGYVNPSVPAFAKAIIKHRFTDFLVWEIARGREVVRLKDIARPETPAPAPTVADAEEDAFQTDGTATGAKAAPQEEPELATLVDAEKLQEIESLHAEGKSSKSVLTNVRRAV